MVSLYWYCKSFCPMTFLATPGVALGSHFERVYIQLVRPNTDFNYWNKKNPGQENACSIF